jgi:thymidine phosphorylase
VRQSRNSLKAIDMGIDTYQEPVIYMRRDCHVCRAEGFTASTRVAIATNKHSIIATLFVVDDRLLRPGYVGLSKIALQRLHVRKGTLVTISHAPLLVLFIVCEKKYSAIN